MPAKTHGHSASRRMTPEYSAWTSIKQRCYNARNPYFSGYGARGITLCDEWRNDFESFLSAVGAKPSALHSLDRIDNSRGYEPGNVRWAYRQQQSLNTRASLRLLTINDEPIPLSQVAYQLALTYNTCRTLFRRAGVL